jgi:hypothetical protein
MNPINLYSGPFTAFLVFTLLLSGCKCDGPRLEREREFTIDIEEDSYSDLLRVKQIFYSLPSPVESAMLLKSSGAIYNEELLNPVENAATYMTNKSMALNLGIYSTNLSYASLFDQAQTCLDYMDAAKRLADNLGILDAIDNYTIERLEQNINDREVLMDIVSETFMNSSSFLQENNREPVAAMMLVGGWVEGLYIALSQIEDDKLEDNRLLKMIIDSRLSLEIVMMLLEDNSHNSDVADLVSEMREIKDIFDQIEVKTSEIQVDRTDEESVTILRSKSDAIIDIELFRQLKSAVLDLRSSFVS